MKRLVWTKDKPNQKGWYFYRELSEEYIASVNEHLQVMLPHIPNPYKLRYQITAIPASPRTWPVTSHDGVFRGELMAFIAMCPFGKSPGYRFPT